MSTVVYIGQSILKIGLLLMGFGLVSIQLMYCVVSLIQMIYILYYVKKTFPWIDLSVEPLHNKIGQRKSVFIHQISAFFFYNSDLVVLTYFCNLMVVSVYAMFQLFFGMVNTLVNNITGSISFLMGQKFSTDREQFLIIQNMYETLNMVLVFSCYSVLCACILPFLKIYTSGVNDINYIDGLLPFLFTAIQLLQTGRISSQKVIEYAGEFQQTQWHAAVEMGLNIMVSIVGAIVLGIYGVLLGTIVALLFRSVMMIDYACRKILGVSQLRVYRKWGINLLLFILLQYLIHFVSIELTSYISVIIYAAILMSISLTVFFSTSFLYDRVSFMSIFEMIKKRIKKS